IAQEKSVSRLLHIRQQNGLLRVPDNVEGQRTCCWIAIAKAVSCQRWRLPASNHFAEISGICFLQALRLWLLDLAGAENFHGDSTCFPFRINQPEQGNSNLAIARKARLAAQHEFSAVLDRFYKRDSKVASAHLPICNRGPGDLVDIDLFRKMNPDFT